MEYLNTTDMETKRVLLNSKNCTNYLKNIVQLQSFVALVGVIKIQDKTKLY